MKSIVRSLLFLSCLLLFAQAEVAVCQDQIIVGRGETISLQLGLQNTGGSGMSPMLSQVVTQHLGAFQ
jgi:hypothetical protein